MTYLPNLLKRINDYSNLNEALYSLAQTSWTMPDDEEPEEDSQEGGDSGLYSKIVAIANELSNEYVANELLLIAELYKETLTINGGYNQVNRKLSTALANIDSAKDDGEIGENEQEIATDIINEVGKDLRQRAKTSTSQNLNDPAIVKRLKEVSDAFNARERQEEATKQPSVYEVGHEEKATGHGIGPRPSAETPRKYALELSRLQDDLDNDPNLS